MKKLTKLGALLCVFVMAMFMLPYGYLSVSADEYEYGASYGIATTSQSIGIIIYRSDVFKGVKELDIPFADNYKFYIYDKNSGKYVEWTNVSELEGGSTALAYSIDGLKKNTSYKFKVAAIDYDGNEITGKIIVKCKTKPAAYPDIRDLSSDLTRCSFNCMTDKKGNTITALWNCESFDNKKSLEKRIDSFEKKMKKRGYVLKFKRCEKMTDPEASGIRREWTRYTYEVTYKGKKVGTYYKDIYLNDTFMVDIWFT